MAKNPRSLERHILAVITVIAIGGALLLLAVPSRSYGGTDCGTVFGSGPTSAFDEDSISESLACANKRTLRVAQVALIGFVVPFLVWGLAATAPPKRRDDEETPD